MEGWEKGGGGARGSPLHQSGDLYYCECVCSGQALLKVSEVRARASWELCLCFPFEAALPAGPVVGCVSERGGGLWKTGKVSS